MCLMRDVKPPRYELFGFRGEVDAGRGSPQKEKFCLPTSPHFKKNHYPCIFEGHLSKNLMLSALHLQGQKSNIYVHFH